MPETEIYSPGLEGVIAGETAISTITGGLRYRGYSVTELAEKASFDEVAHLLLHGELPTASQLKSFQKRLTEARKIPDSLQGLLKVLPPKTSGMDVLRTGVSVLAHYDPEVENNGHDANLRKSEHLLAQIPLIVAAFYRFSKGQEPVSPRSDL